MRGHSCKNCSCEGLDQGGNGYEIIARSFRISLRDVLFVLRPQQRRLARREVSRGHSENDAYEIGKIKTEIDRKTIRLRSEIEKYRSESDGELYAEVFKNFDRLVSLLIVNGGLKKENLYAKEALDDCKQTSGTALTIKMSK